MLGALGAAGVAGLVPVARATSRRLGVALIGLGYYSRDLLAPALQMTQHVRQRIRLVQILRLGQQVNDDLGVGRALEDVTLLFVLCPQDLRVDQISVVRDCDGAQRILP